MLIFHILMDGTSSAAHRATATATSGAATDDNTFTRCAYRDMRAGEFRSLFSRTAAEGQVCRRNRLTFTIRSFIGCTGYGHLRCRCSYMTALASRSRMNGKYAFAAY